MHTDWVGKVCRQGQRREVRRTGAGRADTVRGKGRVQVCGNCSTHADFVAGGNMVRLWGIAVGTVMVGLADEDGKGREGADRKALADCTMEIDWVGNWKERW